MPASTIITNNNIKGLTVYSGSTTIGVLTGRYYYTNAGDLNSRQFELKSADGTVKFLPETVMRLSNGSKPSAYFNKKYDVGQSGQSGVLGGVFNTPSSGTSSSANYDSAMAGKEAYPKGASMNVRQYPGMSTIIRKVASPNSGGKLTGGLARDTEGYKWYGLSPNGYVREDVFVITKPSETSGTSSMGLNTSVAASDETGSGNPVQNEIDALNKTLKEKRKKTDKMLLWGAVGIVSATALFFIIRAIVKKKGK